MRITINIKRNKNLPTCPEYAIPGHAISGHAISNRVKEECSLSGSEAKTHEAGTLVTRAAVQGLKDHSLVLNRYSLWNKDNSLENLYGSLGQNPSGQGQDDDSLVYDRYSLWNKDNSLENLYDSLGQNPSEKGKNEIEKGEGPALAIPGHAISGHAISNRVKDKYGLSVKEKSALSGSNASRSLRHLKLEKQNNFSSEPFGVSKTLKVSCAEQTHEAGTLVTHILAGLYKVDIKPSEFETKYRTEITNKLVARSSQPRRAVGISATLQLKAQKINPNFLVLPGKRIVVNTSKQFNAYET